MLVAGGIQFTRKTKLLRPYVKNDDNNNKYYIRFYKKRMYNIQWPEIFPIGTGFTCASILSLCIPTLLY